LSLILSGCDIEDSRPSYESLAHINSPTEKVMKWSEEDGLLNVDELENKLKGEEKKYFLSLWNGWQLNPAFHSHRCQAKLLLK